MIDPGPRNRHRGSVAMIRASTIPLTGRGACPLLSPAHHHDDLKTRWNMPVRACKPGPKNTPVGARHARIHKSHFARDRPSWWCSNPYKVPSRRRLLLPERLISRPKSGVAFPCSFSKVLLHVVQLKQSLLVAGPYVNGENGPDELRARGTRQAQRRGHASAASVDL